ncbi:MAG: phage tail assembly protein [Desulfobacterales bacterium]|nr:phage tail assembly protein [Desulfobacterales bacterium]
MTENIKLEYPVTFKGSEISELNMRRPKVRDQIAAMKGGKDSAKQELCLFASLCEIEPAMIEELDMKDYQALQEAFSAFLS